MQSEEEELVVLQVLHLLQSLRQQVVQEETLLLDRLRLEVVVEDL
jgi:hypothetical protein